ncbi:MAG: DUF3108 domain-containing protein [Gammaproteobacteria bacterium]|nr:DUF3108 domain-containing protein [Sideroxydans sp.]MBU3903153.1 DUF3108 domain-containing protein [Gammaproteobacteria bacterium]MBU4045534.1 DUF3108 domain-containing protein [Gammaproteobacteria bacterium]
MNFAALSSVRQRLAIALTVSLAIHALLMWLPPIQLPEAEPDLPPLIAKLVPLPQVRTASKRPATPRPKPAATPTDALAAAASAVSAASSVAVTSEPALAASQVAVTSPASAVATSYTPTPVGQVAAATPEMAASAVAAATAPAIAPVFAEAAPPPRPALPKHAFLKFQVRIGKNGMAVGEARHELQIADGRYELTATTRTVGLARLVKSYKLIQTSSGETDGTVLHPQQYSEDKENDGEQRKDSVKLDYAAQKISFSSGRKMRLKESTQDILSILYQFPPLPEPGDVLPIAITNGRDWEKYKFEIATNEELITPLGKLHTVHFRKLHPPGKEGLEIWFAQEYRLLPVKLRHIDRDGSISGEAIITDIRIAEE